jgi:D-3-phosphoglycerate dehydrogenase
MKILVACTLPESALAELRLPGAEVEYQPGLTAGQIGDHVRDAAILIVDRKRVSPQVIAAGQALQLIVRAGTFVWNIAVEEASAQGVFVSNCPYSDAPATAELVMGLVLALDRHLLENAAAVREGRPWSAQRATGRGLTGRSLGVLGYGPVGREVLRLARAFDMKLLAWVSTGPEPGHDSDVEFCAWPRELARKSDVVVVHVPPDGFDEVLISDELLQSMRPGAYLVHVGSPGAIDEDALLAAVKAGKLHVASDLYETDASSEPTRLRSPLSELPGTLVTLRLGGATEQAQAAIAAEVVRIVRQFVLTGEALNCVNLTERSPATWQLVLRLRDVVGVMATIMDAIRADGINAQEITTRVFRGARAAWCAISLDERPSTDALRAIGSLPGVLHLDLRAVV